MFDDNELEQIREERDDWQGHVDRQTVKRSKTSGKIFFGSVGASLVVVSFMVFLTFSGMVSAALIGVTGIGGFGATIDELEGEDVEIYPALGPTAACPSDGTGGEFVDGGDALAGEDDNSVETLPQLRADITDAEIPQGSEITFNKDLAVPEIIDLELIRISITQNASIPNGDGVVGDVELGNASLYVTGLQAEELQAFDTEIAESFSDGSADHPRLGNEGEFVVTGTAEDDDNRVEISGATGRAHFLSFSELTLPNLELAIDYYQSEDDIPDDQLPPAPADDGCPVP